ncbi:MAG: HNH endonuclease signature motif containing protein [Legionella sp.]|uniref:HNH endonuclease signature motif containing protein n=1 Tax=Legionella sp. TaxID=459 RepID=UPI00284CB176|nr:HNH endonuclease signature motif containing protein [Legionella sp.]
MSIEKGSKWWNNGIKNNRSVNRPDETFVLGRIPYERKPFTQERKDNISKSLKGKPSKNKGRKLTEEQKEKMRGPRPDFIPWNKDKKLEYSSWNKGLTVENDIRVFSYVEKQKGQKREGNYYTEDKKWCGEGNYWFGKNRSRENSPRWKGDKYRREYLDYSGKVRYLTEKNYSLYKDIINPNNYERRLSGTDDGYQLDHIIPVYVGFKNKIPPEELADVSNLQIIPWKDNRMKWNYYD